MSLAEPEIIYQGSDSDIPVTIQDDDKNAYPIGTGSTVRLALVDEFGDEAKSTPFDSPEGATGADWPNGIVIFTLTAAESSALEKGTYRLAFGIQDGGKIVKGYAKSPIKIAAHPITFS